MAETQGEIRLANPIGIVHCGGGYACTNPGGKEAADGALPHSTMLDDKMSFRGQGGNQRCLRDAKSPRLGAGLGLCGINNIKHLLVFLSPLAS